MAKQRKKRESSKRAATKRVVAETKIARALNHPLRVELLALLNERPAAPVELSKLLDVPLSNVSYHVRVLRDLDCIEEVEKEAVRGSVKTTYRGSTRMFLDDLHWPKLDKATKGSISRFGVQAMLDRAKEAFEADTFDSREDRHLSTTTIYVDAQGWSEISERLADLLHRVIAIETEAADRASDGQDQRFRATVNLLSFESPCSS